MTDPPDPDFMRRAIRLAINARGRAEPNPLVGCVIVKDGRVIGEGYHRQYGHPHAEPNALAACAESPAGATAYVTLEPCCHTNKQTPPCAPRLIEAQLARVVIGCTDPNPAVDGKGVAVLRAAGLRVDTGVLELECEQLIAPFIVRVVHHRPYVTLKWAQTSDGKVAGPGGARLRISNAASTRLVHQLRARSDAIMVGVNTVRVDDPLLTARDVPDARPLTRVVLDSRIEIPTDSRLLATAREHPLIVYCAQRVPRSALERWRDVEAAGAELVKVSANDDGRPSIPDVLADLGSRGVTHLLVEPGPRLARALLAQHLADRVWVFRSPISLGDVPNAPNAVDFRYPHTATITRDGDTLTEYLNPKSPVFFTNAPSPDLTLAPESP